MFSFSLLVLPRWRIIAQGVLGGFLLLGIFMVGIIVLYQFFFFFKGVGQCIMYAGETLTRSSNTGKALLYRDLSFIHAAFRFVAQRRSPSGVHGYESGASR